MRWAARRGHLCCTREQGRRESRALWRKGQRSALSLEGFLTWTTAKPIGTCPFPKGNDWSDPPPLFYHFFILLHNLSRLSDVFLCFLFSHSMAFCMCISSMICAVNTLQV